MKKLFAVLLGSGIIAAAVVINRDFLSVPTHAEGNRPIKKLQEQPGRPDFIPYMFLFQHLSAVKRRQWQVDELKGKSGLSDAQFDKVMNAANDFAEEVAEYDSIAHEIIEEFHRKYPPGRMPEGQGPGEPPAELYELQARRDDAAIRHRENLKTNLGDDYEKFENLVNLEVRSKISKGKVEPLYKEGK